MTALRLIRKRRHNEAMTALRLIRKSITVPRQPPGSRERA